MSSVVSDTHAALWYLSDDPRLSRSATAAFERAVSAGSPIFVPTICLVEATYLFERSRIDPRIYQVIGAALRDDASSLRPVDLTMEVAQ